MMMISTLVLYDSNNLVEPVKMYHFCFSRPFIILKATFIESEMKMSIFTIKYQVDLKHFFQFIYVHRIYYSVWLLGFFSPYTNGSKSLYIIQDRHKYCNTHYFTLHIPPDLRSYMRYVCKFSILHQYLHVHYSLR